MNVAIKSRRDRERDERRRHIVQAAQESFFELGFEGATMADVARRAELGKGTLYNYFETKEELLVAVALHHQVELIGRFENEHEKAHESGLQLVGSLLKAYATHMETPDGHLRIAMGRWAQGQPLPGDSQCCANMRANLGRLRALFRQALTNGQKDGSIATDVDTEQTGMSLIAGVNGALLLKQQMKCLPDRSVMPVGVPSVADMITLLLRALRVTRGVK